MDNEKIDELVNAITRISYGGDWGPAGLEMLSIAMAGEGLTTPVGTAIENAGECISSSMDRIGEALREIAVALENKSELDLQDTESLYLE